jgi:hypothetical protein
VFVDGYQRCAAHASADLPAVFFWIAMSNRCPIPGCGKRIPVDKFMCRPHRELVSEPAMARIRHCRVTRQRTDLSDEQRLEAVRTLQMAMALAYAEVCDRLGIDLSHLVQNEPKLRANPVMAAIRKEISFLERPTIGANNHESDSDENPG